MKQVISIQKFDKPSKGDQVKDEGENSREESSSTALLQGVSVLTQQMHAYPN